MVHANHPGMSSALRSSLVLALAAGLATGCRSTADQRSQINRPNNDQAFASSQESSPVVDLVSLTTEPQSQPTSGSEPVWQETVQSAERSTPSRRVGTPLNMWGELPGRSRPSMRQSGETFDPYDMRRITYADEGADFDPRMTPQGTHVYFASTRHRDTSDIYIKSISGRAVRQLTTDPAHDVMPSISPDGTQLAFASDRSGNWDIYITDVNGGQARPITSTTAQELHPTFSPDGQRLAYCRLGETSGRWEIWVTDVNNPQVAAHVGYGLFPEWCPVSGTGVAGGDRVLFQKARERGSRFFSLWTLEIQPDTEAGFLTEVASEPDAALINPTWSADGRRVAFVRASVEDSGDETPSNADIVMMNIDGSGLTNLTADDSINLMPAWGNGDGVFFVSDREGSNSIWSVDARAAVIAAGEPVDEVLPVTARGESSVPSTRTASGQNNAPQTDPSLLTGRDASKTPSVDSNSGLTSFTEQP